MAIFTAGQFGADFDRLSVSTLLTGQVIGQDPSGFAVQAGSELTRVFGASLTYGTGGLPNGGAIQRLVGESSGIRAYELTGFNLSAATVLGWATTGADALARTTLLAAADTIDGSGLADLMRGYGGDDTVHGLGGNDYLEGGAGADDVYGDDGQDTVIDSEGSNYLRGGAGDDLVIGGFEFDDAHGNVGNDTVMAGGFDDWSVGGQGNDMVYGEDGSDLCYGQLGSDTVDGGAGIDAVIGGQADDSLSGGAGNDTLSGDRGADTVSGGSGADIFHAAVTAETDRIVDFSAAEGDRVWLDAGSTFTVAQVGADTVITVSGAAQVVLVGVSMSSLGPATIFLA